MLTSTHRSQTSRSRCSCFWLVFVSECGREETKVGGRGVGAVVGTSAKMCAYITSRDFLSHRTGSSVTTNYAWFDISFEIEWLVV